MIKFQDHEDLNLEEACNFPESELFLLSILLCRPLMARVFWEEGNVNTFILN